MNRYLIIIHVFMLSACVLIRVFLTGRLFAEGVDFNSQKYFLPLVLFFTLFTILISMMAFATHLVIAIRFYKNLFSSEGYLSHTLPVTSGQHLLSKTISGSIWGIINMISLHIALFIVAATPHVISFVSENKAEIMERLGFTGSRPSGSFLGFLLLYIVVCLIGTATNVILFYSAITIGQLISGHKILGAIAAYFVINTTVSVAALIITAYTGLLGASMNLSTAVDSIKYLKDSLIMNGIFSFIQTAVLYLVIYWIMKKKVNLD
ncbi:MAG: hypothetical protein HFG95_13125 [Dorea sp.]|nr:hypothetical protein [Dorea sp.]